MVVVGGFMYKTTFINNISNSYYSFILFILLGDEDSKKGPAKWVQNFLLIIKWYFLNYHHRL